MDHLTRIEEILLLSVWRLRDEAYGLAVRRAVSKLLGRRVSVGAVYVPLERLAQQGLLESWESEPTEKRGGRRKRFYRLTEEGVTALNAIRSLEERAWTGLPDAVGGLRLDPRAD